LRKLLLSLMVLVLLFSCTTIKSEEIEGSEPVPYEEDEFPPALKKLRRAEILLVGSLPLFYMFTSMGYDILITDQPDSQTQLTQKITLSLSLSGLLTLTDFILGERETKGETPYAGD
jgi:hypothetical protein